MAGRLEFILGAMSSGKSEFIINKLMRRVIAGYNVQHFVPRNSLRESDPTQRSIERGGYKIDFNIINEPDEIIHNLDDATEVIGIDELHFYDERIVEVINKIINKGIQIYTCTIDPDFRGKPVNFNGSDVSLYEIIPMSDEIHLMTAICTHADSNGNICGSTEARWNQKYYGDEVAPYDSPLIEAGNIKPNQGVWYAPRCREHFKFY